MLPSPSPTFELFILNHVFYNVVFYVGPLLIAVLYENWSSYPMRTKVSILQSILLILAFVIEVNAVIILLFTRIFDIFVKGGCQYVEQNNIIDNFIMHSFLIMLLE